MTRPLTFASEHKHADEDYSALSRHILGVLNTWEDGKPACYGLAAEALMQAFLAVLEAEARESGEEARFERMVVASFMAAIRYAFPHLDGRGETLQ